MSSTWAADEERLGIGERHVAALALEMRDSFDVRCSREGDTLRVVVSDARGWAIHCVPSAECLSLESLRAIVVSLAHRLGEPD